jgi:2-C-methyl-D-erythritol 4-phosphate cytidylyltransferase
MEQYVLIVAAGKGERMNSGLPKQFIEIARKPMLMHAIEAFVNPLQERKFVVVLPSGLMNEWENLCSYYHFHVPCLIVEGGPRRFYSVKSGLKQVPDDVLVAIHDAARPFVSDETIQRCFKTAFRKGNAVPSVELSQSVREVSGALNKSIDRTQLRLVQTPQVFHSTLIKKAYRQSFRERFTDDASVLESIGYQIHLVEDSTENFKITTPADLEIARFLLERKLKPES